MNIPRLETGQLVLRENRLRIFPPMPSGMIPAPHAIFPPCIRRGRSLASAFCATSDSGYLLGYGLWGLRRKRAAASSARWDFSKPSVRLIFPAATCLRLVAIAPDFHRRGLVREALTAALGWADKHIPAPETWCMINIQNEISGGWRNGRDIGRSPPPIIKAPRYGS